MSISISAGHSGQSAVLIEPTMLALVDSSAGERFAAVIDSYYAQSAAAPVTLAASALLRRLEADFHGSHAGVLHVDVARASAHLAALGDVQLWRCRGRHTERCFPPPGALPRHDAIGLPGSQTQRVRISLAPGDRLVVGTHKLTRLTALELYAVLSSPRGPTAAAEALVAQVGDEAVAVGVLHVDPQR